MLILIITSFYFILPAYVANMAPVIFAKLNLLNYLSKPIDGGYKIGQQDFFGKNKTWRGLVAGLIMGILVAFVQSLLVRVSFFAQISLVDYQHIFILFGAASGAGALLGDLIKSFIKRRINIDSGKSWPVFDQLDFVIGSLLFTWSFYVPTWQVALTIIILTLILHPLANLSGYWLKLKKVWW
ncbi:MAG: CDP-2,3-bis-(O-geranylgeranyl)-sn-glycerol synthase [bacterium]